MAQVENVTPGVLAGWMEAGEVLLIDVRDPERYATRRIRDARSMPLPTLDLSQLPPLDGRRLVFQCEVGITSHTAAQHAVAAGIPAVHNLEGGIRAWRKAGLPVVEDTRRPLPLQRQVQMIAGTLVAAGTTLGYLLTPWFLLLPAFVGLGLLYAGATGNCGMTALLVRLPYNRRALRT